MTGPVLDLNQLNRATGGDEKLRTEVLGLFCAEIRSLRDLIMEPGQISGVGPKLHRLKGSALALGADELAAEASRLETSPSQDDLSGLIHAMERLEAEIAFHKLIA